MPELFVNRILLLFVLVIVAKQLNFHGRQFAPSFRPLKIGETLQ
jgi:hypothetical protein